MRLAPYAGRKAVNRARAYVGRRAFTGMCQAFTVTMFGTGGVGDWDGDGDADAIDGWKKAVARGRVRTARQINDYSKIPHGVALYWSGGSRGYGHAAVSIGGGRMVTTDGAPGGVIAIRDIRGFWAGTHTFLGYAYAEGNGPFIMRRIHSLAKAKPAAKPKPVPHVVTSRVGVNVRTGPSTKAPIRKAIPRGYRFGVVGTEGVWLKTTRGDYVHSNYARKA